MVIYDNYFAYTTAYRQELIQAGIRLFGLEYVPIQELKMVGLAYLDCTDIVKIIEPDNTEIITIPLNHIIEYNGSISDSLSSQTNSSNEENYKNTNNPINANSLAEIVVDRALKQIKLIVDNFVDLSKTKTGNNYLFIDDIPTGDGYITKLIVKGNTEYFTQTNITIIASEGTKNQETTLITENEDTLLTESADSILTESKTLYVAKQNITLSSPLRSLIVDGQTYYDELQILQNGTIKVVKRIGISQNETLYLLDEEEVIILENTLVLPSSENGYYYFIEEINNLDYYAEYIFKNEYSNMFATTLQLQSEIKLLEDIISLSVSELSTNLNAKLDLKVNLIDLISEINASADVIRLIGQRLIIDMQNYGLDETGYMMALKGEIAGFNFLSNKFSKAYNMLYNFTGQDVQLLMGYLNDYNSLSSSLQSLYELIGDSSLNVLDVVKMVNIINGTVENTKTSSGEVSINSDDSNNLINITNNLGVNKTRIGIISIYAYLLSADIISLAESVDGGDLNGIILDKNKIKITLRDSNNNKTTTILPSGITTPTVVQTSKSESKKNFELLENALDIVNKTDIYKYNFLEEDNADKKHIGFVIGENFNYAEEVTSKDNDGAEVYSLAAVCLQAIKEQQKEIEELKLEIAKLKGEN